jgi:sugar phosphate isomerase/epimerase
LSRRIALQTWTVRELLRSETAQVLRLIRDIGYRNVELAASGRRPREEFKELCATLGLKIIGIHLPALTAANLGEAIEGIKARCKLFQCRYATVMRHRDGQGTREYYQEYADLCTKAGTALRKEGLQLCYHCYHYDLVPLSPGHDEASGLELLLESTEPECLSVQLDTYFLWKSQAPYDVVLQKSGPRCRLVHVNDIDRQGRQAPLGKGIIPWAEIMTLFQEQCAPEFFIVEHRTDHPIEWIRQSISFIKNDFSKVWSQ